MQSNIARISIPPEVHPDCVEFVSVVEELLLQRQRNGAPRSMILPFGQQEDDWGPRKWHRTELEDSVYSSYKRMRQGHITRPPRRKVVMEIADYLNCTLMERNRLLIAAHTFPVESYLTGSELESVLQSTIEVARMLPMPAMIINRDWRIHYLNGPMLRFYDISLEQITALPASYRNFLHLLFDPALPLYGNLIVNRESWTRMVLHSIYCFKIANLLCVYEPWYQQVVNQLMQLPEFAQCWQQVSLENHIGPVPGLSTGVILETMIPCMHDATRSVFLRLLVISPGYYQFDFPQIIGLLPAHPESEAIFREIGLPYPVSPPTGQIVP
jgi:hypothetical protein